MRLPNDPRKQLDQVGMLDPGAASHRPDFVTVKGQRTLVYEQKPQGSHALIPPVARLSSG